MVPAFWEGGRTSAGPGGRAGPRGLLHPQQLRGPVAVVAAGLASPALGSGSVWGKSSFNPSFHEYLVFISSCFMRGLAVRLPLPIFPFLGYLEYA